MMKKIFAAAVVAVSLVSCHSENPFISKKRAQELGFGGGFVTKPMQGVAAIINNDVYFWMDFNLKPTKIETDLTGKKKHIRISKDYSQLAFLSGESLILMDTLGNYDSYDSEGISAFDWTEDGKTLWLVQDNVLYIIGDDIVAPPIEIDPGEKVLSAALTRHGDLLYIVQFGSSFSGYKERLEIRTPGGYEQTINRQAGEIRHMQTIRLSKDGDHYVIGYVTAYGREELVKLEIYNATSDVLIETLETEMYIDPVYDHSSKYMVTASASSSFDNFVLMAEYVRPEVGEEDRNIYKTNFSGKPGAIYVDWK